MIFLQDDKTEQFLELLARARSLCKDDTKLLAASAVLDLVAASFQRDGCRKLLATLLPWARRKAKEG